MSTKRSPSVVYILSTPDRAAANIYKIGRHTGTEDKLLSRYRTALIKPTIYGFYHVKSADKVEQWVLWMLRSRRMLSDKGRKTEWVEASLDHIVRTIGTAINVVNSG